MAAWTAAVAVLAGAAAGANACGSGGGAPAGSASGTPAGSAGAASSAPASGGSPTAAGAPSGAGTSAPGAANPARPGSSEAAPANAAACTRARLASWPVRRLALLTVAVPAPETDPAQAVPEVADGAGGVILFGSSAPADLGSRISALRAHVPGGHGLLVMTDEEGGGVQRMANLVGSLPWAAWMGQHWSAGRIESEAARTGARMAAAGVNMDLAPVADVDGRQVPPGPTDPDGLRSFSGDPGKAGEDAAAFARGLRRAGVIPVLKHFPGLGGSTANSDDTSAATLPWAQLRTRGLPPFRAGIDAGAPAVMVANNSVPGLSAGPAGLSSAAVGQLREGLGFRGLVLTDSLSAGAIGKAGYTVPSAAVQALRAGADMVMFDLASAATTEETTRSIADAVTAAVSRGTLSRDRLLDAAASVLAVRQVDLCGK